MFKNYLLLKKINLILIFFILSMSYNAQLNFSWAKRQGSTSNDMGRSITIDLNHNVISTGMFSGTVDFDPGPGVFTLTAGALEDSYICKFDSLGNFLWAKKFGITNYLHCYDVTTDASGNVLTTGLFYNGSSVDFDPGPGTYTLSSPGTYAMFVSKLDPSGNFIWAKMIGGPFGCTCVGNSIACDAGGNVVVAGTSDGGTVDYDPGAGVYNVYSSNWDAFVCKLDVNGNFNWANVYLGSGYNHGTGVSVDPSGDIIATGDFGSTVDYDLGPGVYNLTASPVSYNDIFICKVTAAGNFVWAKRYGDVNDDGGYSVINDAIGNIYATGWFNGLVDFDAGPATFTLNTGAFVANAYILKLDPAGNFLWVKQIGNTTNWEQGHTVVVDAVNNVYSSGTFGGTVDFDPGPSTFTLNSLSSTSYIVKLDTSGNFVWAHKTPIFVNSSWAYFGRSIGVDKSTRRNLCTGGYLTGTSDLDLGPAVNNLTSAGLEDISTAKYCQIPDKPSMVSGPAVSCNSINNFSVLPVFGAVSYSWSLPAGLTGTSTTNSITTTGFGSGTISVTAINSCGSSFVRTFSVIVTPTLNVTVNTASICVSGTVNLIANGAWTYTWSTGANTNSISVSPTVTTIYTVTGSGLGCVDDVKTTTVMVSPVAPTVSVNTPTICVGQTATLTVGGASTYSWNTGSTASSFTVSPPGSIGYTVTGYNGVCSQVKTTAVYVNPLPTIGAGSSGPVCAGSNVCLASSGGNTYVWSGPCGFSSTLQSPCFPSSMSCTCIYSVVGTNTTTGCSRTATTCVTVNACTAIDENEKDEIFSLFPNPNNGNFIINTNSESMQLNIINVLGQKVFKQDLKKEINMIDVGHLPHGIYYVVLKNNAKIKSDKLIIE